MLKLLLLLLVCVSTPLYAQYLDPGTASYILQILLAVALSSLFYIKQIFAFLKRMVGKLTHKVSRNDNEK
jgi:hypothetical protein